MSRAHVSSHSRLDRFADDCIVIRLNKSIDEAAERLGDRFDGRSDEYVMALYDATRAAWPVDIDKAGAYRYVLAAHQGVVLEVYEVAAWLPAGSTMELDPTRRHPPERFEFVGRIAPDVIRRRYRHRSVAHRFRHGDQFPVRYFRAGS